MRGLALLTVDDQLELGFDELRDVLHHPLGGAAAPDQNQEIVGSTAQSASRVSSVLCPSGPT